MRLDKRRLLLLDKGRLLRLNIGGLLSKRRIELLLLLLLLELQHRVRGKSLRMRLRLIVGKVCGHWGLIGVHRDWGWLDDDHGRLGLACGGRGGDGGAPRPDDEDDDGDDDEESDPDQMSVDIHCWLAGGKKEQAGKVDNSGAREKRDKKKGVCLTKGVEATQSVEHECAVAPCSQPNKSTQGHVGPRRRARARARERAHC